MWKYVYGHKVPPRISTYNACERLWSSVYRMKGKSLLPVVCKGGVL